MSKILAVDDEPAILDAVEMALTQDGHVVRPVASGQAALAVFESFAPDLLVLDRLLPDGDGLSVCRQLRCHSQVPILMLTALGELDDRVVGLDGGADDYLAKPFRVRELQARVRALLRRTGRAADDDEWRTVGPLKLSLARRQVILDGHPIELTTRELDLLACLAARPGRVYTKEQLLESVWSWDDAQNPNLVEAYVSSLRSKLGRRDLIRTVRGVGYAFNDPP